MLSDTKERSKLSLVEVARKATQGRVEGETGA